jgi:Effector-associated domain 1
MEHCWDERFGRFLLDFLRESDLNNMFSRELLFDVVEHRVEGAREYAASLLIAPIAPQQRERSRALGAAQALIVHAHDVGWPVIWPVLRNDPGFGREMIEGVVSLLPILGTGTWGDALSEDEAADLCIWLEEQFPTSNNPPESQSAQRHRRTSLEMVHELRNAVDNNLIRRGTQEAVTAIERLAKAVPQRDRNVNLVLAKQAMAQGTWIPRSLRDVLTLRPATAVTSAADAPRAHALTALAPGKLAGAEMEEIAEALLSAFPTRDALAQMLRFKLDKKLDEIAAATNLRATVFELLGAAEAKGWVPALVDAALRYVPGNPALQVVAAKHLA